MILREDLVVLCVLQLDMRAWREMRSFIIEHPLPVLPPADGRAMTHYCKIRPRMIASNLIHCRSRSHRPVPLKLSPPSLPARHAHQQPCSMSGAGWCASPPSARRRSNRQVTLLRPLPVRRQSGNILRRCAPPPVLLSRRHRSPVALHAAPPVELSLCAAPLRTKTRIPHRPLLLLLLLSRRF